MFTLGASIAFGDAAQAPSAKGLVDNESGALVSRESFLKENMFTLGAPVAFGDAAKAPTVTGLGDDECGARMCRESFQKENVTSSGPRTTFGASVAGASSLPVVSALAVEYNAPAPDVTCGTPSPSSSPGDAAAGGPRGKPCPYTDIRARWNSPWASSYTLKGFGMQLNLVDLLPPPAAFPPVPLAATAPLGPGDSGVNPCFAWMF